MQVQLNALLLREGRGRRESRRAPPRAGGGTRCRLRARGVPRDVADRFRRSRASSRSGSSGSDDPAIAELVALHRRARSRRGVRLSPSSARTVARTSRRRSPSRPARGAAAQASSRRGRGGVSRGRRRRGVRARRCRASRSRSARRAKSNPAVRYARSVDADLVVLLAPRPVSTNGGRPKRGGGAVGSGGSRKVSATCDGTRAASACGSRSRPKPARRSTKTFPGLAALVDRSGEVVAQLPEWHAGTLVVDVPL